MTSTYKNDRDANERGLIKLLRACGCVVWQMDRKAGFDLLVICPRTGTHIVEIKNPARKWTLTSAERTRQVEVELVDGIYWIIETDEQARAMIDM